MAQVAVQRVHYIGRLRQARRQDIGQIGELWFNMFLGLKKGMRAGQCGNSSTFVFLQDLKRPLRSVQQGLCMGQAFVLGVELLPLVITGPQLVHFADLPLQALALLLQCGLRGARLLQCLEVRAPLRPAGCCISGVHTGESVKQASHRLWSGQALPRVLTVDVDKHLAQRAQLGGCSRGAIDPRAALALRVDGTAQQQPVIGFKPSFIQPGAGVRGAVKLRANVGLAASLSHHARICTRPQGQLQCVDQNGLSCTCLPGQHGEAIAQIQFQRLYDHEIAQGNLPQRHGQEPPSFQRSFLRSVAK